MNYNYYTTFIDRIKLPMKKLFLLIALMPLTLLGQNNNNSTAKTIVNKFIEVGWKAGLNFDSSGEILNIAHEFNRIAAAKGLVNGFHIVLYTHINLSQFYVSP